MATYELPLVQDSVQTTLPFERIPFVRTLRRIINAMMKFSHELHDVNVEVHEARVRIGYFQ